MLDVVALGELLIDFTCLSTDKDGYPTMAAHPGGAPANYLAAVRKFGGSAAMIGKVGDDAFGRMLRQTLNTAGIDTTGLITDDSVFTTLAFVTLDEAGDRSFSFGRKPGADTMLRWEEVDRSLLDQTKVFHFGTLSLTNEPAAEATRQAVAYARSKGAWISFDPNLRPPLWNNQADAARQMLWGLSQADVVKISDEEVAFLFGLSPEEGAKKILSDYPAKLVFVTCGAEGAVFRTRSAGGFAAAPRGLTVADTTGAGDIFGGSAMWRLLQTGKAPEELDAETLREITAFACTAASLSTTVPGGISSVPELNTVLAKLTK